MVRIGSNRSGGPRAQTTKIAQRIPARDRRVQPRLSGLATSHCRFQIPKGLEQPAARLESGIRNLISLFEWPRLGITARIVDQALDACDSSQDRANDFASRIGQAVVAAVVREGEPCVVEPEEVKDRGVQVVHVHAIDFVRAGRPRRSRRARRPLYTCRRRASNRSHAGCGRGPCRFLTSACGRTRPPRSPASSRAARAVSGL